MQSINLKSQTRRVDELCSSLVDNMTVPHSAASADGSDAGFFAEVALKVPVTASVEWVRSAATRQGVVVYTHPTIHERGSGRMMSAATVPLVPLGHGWGGGGVGAGRSPPRVRSTKRNGIGRDGSSRFQATVHGPPPQGDASRKPRRASRKSPSGC